MQPGFTRQSTKGLTYPLLPGGTGADVTALVDTIDAFIREQWATNLEAVSALMYGYKGGVVLTGGAWIRIADGTLALADDSVNYVERSAAGVVSSNTVGFGAGNTPMAKVTTAAGRITDVEDWRP